jgi:hypothetical protein
MGGEEEGELVAALLPCWLREPRRLDEDKLFIMIPGIVAALLVKYVVVGNLLGKLKIDI